MQVGLERGGFRIAQGVEPFGVEGEAVDGARLQPERVARQPVRQGRGEPVAPHREGFVQT
jgi:hypothetical protein